MLLGILLAIHIVVCIALIGVILIQRSEGGALGMGGGGGGNFMSARGAGDLLTRTTQILAAVFFILSLAMTIVAGRGSESGSLVDRLPVGGIDVTAPAQTAPAQTAPAKTAPDAAQAPAEPAEPAPLEAPTPQVRSPAADLLAPAPAAP